MSNEELADRLGQIIFRIETNASYLRPHFERQYQTEAIENKLNALKDIQADLEKLKEMKAELLKL